MCLIAFRWQPDTDTPLLVAANRDEFYARPAAPLAWWPDGRILAGRDLQAGGSWMGVTRDGRFAALTNYRDPRDIKPGAPSRGALVAGFLAGSTGAADYLAGLRPAAAYNGFNLLLYDGRELLGYESRADRVLRFDTGVHAVSNAAFDTPWPKVEALKAGLAIEADDDAALFALLADPAIAPDERLPATGVPLEWERALSAALIRTPDYGTRASTVLRLGRRTVGMTELSYARGVPAGERSFRFELD
ncbi:NRDE family protein [Chitinimonas koreensis]|uniref:NRDE family protein n=1 Tax=Chitinimonas koreensis TaxID=356302 RepID=UPI00041C0C66|nr:NRDE family protein [Chitinimonas koreensis]QNM96624.1 NRDE family protein [Chitinimonas koreensis]